MKVFQLDLLICWVTCEKAPEDVDGFTFTGRKFGGRVVGSRDGVEDEQKTLLHKNRFQERGGDPFFHTKSIIISGW